MSRTRTPRRRWLWLAVAVLALGGCAAAAAWAVRRVPDWIRGAIETRAQRALGVEARIETVHWSAWPPGVELRGVRLRHGAALDLEVRRVQLRWGWRELWASWSGEFRVRRLIVDGLRLQLDNAYLAARRPAPRAAGRWRWRIGSLRVQDAVVAYRDRAWPWELEAQTLSVEGRWSTVEEAVRGAVEVQGIAALPWDKRAGFEARGGFTWGPGGFAIESLALEGAGFQGRVESAHWRPGTPPNWAVQGRATLALQEASWLPGAVAGWGGDVSLAWRWARAGEESWRLTGELRAPRLRRRAFEARDLQGTFEVEPGRWGLRLDGGDFAGGRLAGSLEGRREAEGQWRVVGGVRGRRLDLAALVSALGRSLPLRSRLDFALQIEGPGLDPRAWRLAGQLRGTPQAAPGRVPLAVEGPFQIEDQQCAFGPLRYRTAAMAGEVEGSLALPGGRPLVRRLAVRASSLARVQQEVSILAEAWGTQLPPLARRPLDGAGELACVLDSIRAGSYRCRARLEHAEWGELAVRAGRAEWSMGPSGVHLSAAQLRGPDWQARVAGSWDAAARTLELDPFEVERMPVEAWLVPWLPAWRGGFLDARGSLRVGRRGEAAAGQARFVLRDGAAWDESIETAEGVLRAEGGVWRIEPLTVQGPAGRVQAALRFDPGTRAWELEAVQADLTLERLRSARRWGLAGAATLSGGLAQRARAWSGKLELSSENVRFRGFDLGALAGTAVLADEHLDLTLSRMPDGGFHAEGRVELRPPWPAVAVAYFDQLIFETPATAAQEVWARIDGEITWRGALRALAEGSAAGRLKTVELFAGARRFWARDVEVVLREGVFELGPCRLEGTATQAELSLRWDAARDHAEAHLHGTLDAGILSAWWPELQARGSVSLDLDAEGTLRQPRFRGRARMEGGRLRVGDLREPLEQLAWEVIWDGGATARVERITARLGGGVVTGAGEIQLQGWEPRSYRLDVELTLVRLTLPEGFRGTYEGRLVWEGDRTRSRLSGKLTLVRGRYREPFEFSAWGGVAGPAVLGTAAWQPRWPLELDLEITAPGQVWVRNPIAQIELAGELRLRGAPDRLTVEGVVRALEGGRITLRDVVYSLESARFELDERLPVFDPYVEVQATTRVGDYEIALQVHGPLGRLNYELSSEPSLPPQDIVALLATGRPPEPGGVSPARTLGDDLVAAYFAQALTEPFERQLRRLLRLERVRIDPMLLAGQGDPTTRITVGEQVGDRVFLTYSTDLGGTTERQLYQVEWQFSRKFRLLFERDTTGGVGGAFRYTRRLGGGAPSPRAGRAPPRGAPAPTIVELQWEGPAELQRELGFEAGDPLERATLVERLLRLRSALVRGGFLEGQIETRVETLAEGVRLRVEVVPGPQVDFRITGLPRRAAKQLRQMLQEELWSEFFLGEDVYEETLKEAQRALHEQGYYAADLMLRRERISPSRVRAVLEVDRGPLVRVAEVQVKELGTLPEDEWRRRLQTRPGVRLRRLVPKAIEEDEAALLGLCQARGYLAAQVGPARVQLSLDGSRARVFFPVEEGPQFRIAKVDIEVPEPFDPDRVRRWSGLEVGAAFHPGDLARAERAVRDALDRRGYAAAAVQAEPELADASVRVRLRVQPGQARRIVGVELRGNERTKAKVILRELRLETGAPLSRAQLLEAQHRLSRLGLFRSVRIRWRPQGEAGAVVEVEVEEAAPISMSVGAGYDTEAGARLSFSASHDNPGGRGRQLAFQGRLSQLERRLQWLMRDPRLFSRSNWNGLVNLSWEELDEVAFDLERRAVSVRLERRVGRYWIHHYRYRFQRLDLSEVEDTTALLEQKLENLRLGELAYALIRDSRDDPFLPQRGNLWSAELRWFAPALGSDVPFVKLFLQASGVRPLRRYGSLAGAMRLGIAHTTRAGQAVPLSERFFAGGDATLRGFPRDRAGPRDPVTGLPTGGEGLVLFNAEWRFPVWHALKGVLFYDTGNVFAKARQARLSKLRHVLGFGFRFETPLGPIRLEYGRKLDREPGESRGEIFFAIGNAF